MTCYHKTMRRPALQLAMWQIQLMVVLLPMAAADVLVISEMHAVELELKDMPSTFGDAIPLSGMAGKVVYSKPANACMAIEPPPFLKNYSGNWIVLIRRYDCNFDVKVRNAQEAGYDLAIVHNVNSTDIAEMNAVDPRGIHIPSVFVNDASGDILKYNYLYTEHFYVLVNGDVPFNLSKYLIVPALVVICVSLITVLVYLITKCVRERRQQNRLRLPSSLLKQLAVHKYKPNDQYETCAICLEDYMVGDKLRVLPCAHAYHLHCIDPWLTGSRRVCPCCKRIVFPSDTMYSDDDDDGDDNETSPLVPNNRSTINSGTFDSVNNIITPEPLIRSSSRSSTSSSSSSSSSSYSSPVGVPHPSEVAAVVASNTTAPIPQIAGSTQTDPNPPETA